MIEKINSVVSKIQNTAKYLEYASKVITHVLTALRSIPKLDENDK